jgi:hypothetical protein
MSVWNVGDRVRVVAPIEIYPIATFSVGLTGTVSEIDTDPGFGILAMVTLDDHYDGLDEWSNALQVWIDGAGSDCTLDKFEIITDDAHV